MACTRGVHKICIGYSGQLAYRSLMFWQRHRILNVAKYLSIIVLPYSFIPKNYRKETDINNNIRNSTNIDQKGSINYGLMGNNAGY